MTPAPKPGVFRVGDRVRIRGFAYRQVDGSAAGADGLRAAVTGIGDYFLIVAIRGLSGPHQVFPSQCRKIVPRKRREWEMRGVHHDGPLIGCQPEWDFVVSGPKLREGETVRVREVKRK